MINHQERLTVLRTTFDLNDRARFIEGLVTLAGSSFIGTISFGLVSGSITKAFLGTAVGFGVGGVLDIIKSKIDEYDNRRRAMERDDKEYDIPRTSLFQIMGDLLKSYAKNEVINPPDSKGSLDSSEKARGLDN